MRRMYDRGLGLSSPLLVHEEEITNNSSINVKLNRGSYLIVLHQRYATNNATLIVTEDSMNISSSTLFNVSEVGTSSGAYQYDSLGQLLEIYNSSENPITISGHIDIYRI